MLQLNGLSVRLRHTAQPLLQEIALRIDAGEVVGLIGASGAGKSLTARALLGLLPPECFATAWECLRLRDLELRPESKALQAVRGSRIGLIFQEPLTALHPTLTVGTQIAEVLIRHRGRSRRAAWQEAIAWLERVEIREAEQTATRYPHQLSGGQRQRVAIAQALAPNPELIIADEPLSAVDPLLGEELMRLLVREVRSQGRGLLLIAHDLTALARHADRVYVLDAGRIVESGRPSRLFAFPKQEATRKAVAALLVDRSTSECTLSFEADARLLLEIDRLVVDAPAPWFDKARTILNGVSLSLRRKEILGLIGLSGCGKSTLARALVGLAPVRAGRIRLEGRELSGLSPAAWRPLRRKIQIVFQDPGSSLDPRMRIEAIVSEGPRLHGLVASGRQGRAIAAAALAAVGLDETFLARYPHELSGGQRQRVAIARALALEPELLILDEAVSALDPASKLEILDLLAALRARFGLSLLLIAHDLAAVARLSDRIAVMDEGQIVEHAPAAQLLLAPQHPLTRRLLAVASPAKER